MNICTTVTKNYVAFARVLAESFKEHHPDGTCYALVVDETEGYVDPTSEPFELVTPADLNVENFDHRAGIYNVFELATSMKPRLLSYLLNERGMERVAFVDPDIRLYDRFDRLEELARGYELVLTPQTTSPVPRDGKRPSESEYLLTGIYNTGLIAIERGASTDRFLDWWSERLKTDCVVAPELGYFAEQRWLDFVHCLVPGFCALRNPGYNVAFWNLHYRNLTIEKDRYYVNGKPLHSFHFGGYDPEHRDLLTGPSHNRIQLRKGSALARICDEYADALFAHGYNEVKDWPYTYNTLPNGIKLDRYMRRLYRAGTESGEFKGSIFTPEGADRFVAWLDEPAPVGGKHGVTRYLYEVYSVRPGLRQRFPNLDGPDGAAFIEWARRRRFAKRIAYTSTEAVTPSPLGRVAGFARRVLGPALGPPRRR